MQSTKPWPPGVKQARSYELQKSLYLLLDPSTNFACRVSAALNPIVVVMPIAGVMQMQMATGVKHSKMQIQCRYKWCTYNADTNGDWCVQMQMAAGVRHSRVVCRLRQRLWKSCINKGFWPHLSSQHRAHSATRTSSSCLICLWCSERPSDSTL